MIGGHVYVIHTVLARPPKDKITVCVCADQNFFFWINTNSQRHCIGQLPLSAGDHSALTRACFLDCSRVITFPQYELDAAQHRGPISASLAQRIVELLETNPPKTLAPRFLRLAVAQLAPLFR